MLEDYPQYIYDREFPEQEALFAPIAETLKQFAVRHNLNHYLPEIRP